MQYQAKAKPDKKEEVVEAPKEDPAPVDDDGYGDQNDEYYDEE